MKQSRTSPAETSPPVVTGRDTRAELLARARRPTVPIRKTFVQAPPGQTPRHGPLKAFVSGGDLRGLRAYLVIVAANSAENSDGWRTTLDSAIWARLFDADLSATSPAARTAAWRTLGRLEDRGLVSRFRERGGRKISVTLLREDGSGAPYTRPDGKSIPDRFLRLPRRFWTDGYDARIDVPGLAMLLTISAERPWSSFPAERMEEWYGWSPDTTLRGLRKLRELDLIERRETYKKAALSSPTGVTMLHQYQLVRWMRPKAGPKPTGTRP